MQLEPNLVPFCMKTSNRVGVLGKAVMFAILPDQGLELSRIRCAYHYISRPANSRLDWRLIRGIIHRRELFARWALDNGRELKANQLWTRSDDDKYFITEMDN